MLALLASSTTGGIDPQVRLTMACRSLVASEVTAALAEGARADHVDERLRTPLHLVARTNKENNSPDKPAQQAALVAAQEQCVRLLLDAGAQVNAQDDEGNTPLHHAASNRSAVLVAQLLDAGADATLANHKHYTPLTVRHPFYHPNFPEEEGSPATRTAQAFVERIPSACLAKPDPAGRLPLKAWRQMPFMQTRLVAHALNQVLPPTSGASQTKRRL